MSGVIGEDIVMWGCQIFCKPGSDGMEVPMHQDGQYWPIRPLATCTVWLAIDDSDRENGCLTVIPGSHRNRETFRHRTRTDDDIVLNQAVDDPRAFARPPAHVELERGQLSMHDIYLIHGSAPNTSGPAPGGPRAPLHADHVVVPARPRDAVLGLPARTSRIGRFWLARGRDVCGRNDFAVGHTAPVTERTAVSRVARKKGKCDSRLRPKQRKTGAAIAEIVELPGVMQYGESRDEASARAETLALRVRNEHFEVRRGRSSMRAGADDVLPPESPHAPPSLERES